MAGRSRTNAPVSIRPGPLKHLPLICPRPFPERISRPPVCTQSPNEMMMATGALSGKRFTRPRRCLTLREKYRMNAHVRREIARVDELPCLGGPRRRSMLMKWTWKTFPLLTTNHLETLNTFHLKVSRRVFLFRSAESAFSSPKSNYCSLQISPLKRALRH